MKRRVKLIGLCAVFVSLAIISIVLISRAITAGIWLNDYKCVFNLEKKTVKIVDYRGKDSVVTAPGNYILGFKMEEMFEVYDDESIKKIIIPANAEYHLQVRYLDSLESVIFEEGTTYINASIMDCNSLEEVVIPEGVKEIRWSAFARCKKLENIILPKELEDINQNAFYGTKFEQKHNKDKYYVAGDNVLIFYNGPNEEVVIPYGIKTMTDDTYDKWWKENYSKPKQIYFPSSLENLSCSLAEETTAYFGSEFINFGDEEMQKIMAENIKGTIVAPEGSYMQEFCQKYDLNFRVMTEEEEAIWREKTEAAASEITYQE